MAEKVVQKMDAPGPAPAVQRKCDECEKEQVSPKREDGSSALRRKSEGGVTPLVQRKETNEAPPDLETSLQNSKGGGQPLDKETQQNMGQGFNADFSNVKIHTGGYAVQMAQSIGAQAFTNGSDVYFNSGKYAPHTHSGKKLLAHELTHVIQQQAVPGIQRKTAPQSPGSMSFLPGNMAYLQRYPGDGMTPPGDCSWLTYIGLRGSVETAKALVSSLGGCSVGDSCIFLATKIAAISAEIAARVALDATCFKGGDAGHRQQVTDKINMLNRCYRFFSNSNCPPGLVAAMAVVVERARQVIAMAAMVVAIVVIVAAIAALILAIIALVEVIAAAIAAVAAAAEMAAITAAAAAIITVLTFVKDELS